MKNETNESEKKTWEEPKITDNGVTVRSALLMAAVGGILAAVGASMINSAAREMGEGYHFQIGHLPAIEKFQAEELPESFQDRFSRES